MLRLTDATPNGLAVVYAAGSVNIISFDPTSPQVGFPIHV
jgi:hypothetical protein